MPAEVREYEIDALKREDTLPDTIKPGFRFAFAVSAAILHSRQHVTFFAMVLPFARQDAPSITREQSYRPSTYFYMDKYELIPALPSTYYTGKDFLPALKS